MKDKLVSRALVRRFLLDSGIELVEVERWVEQFIRSNSLQNLSELHLLKRPSAQETPEVALNGQRNLSREQIRYLVKMADGVFMNGIRCMLVHKEYRSDMGLDSAVFWIDGPDVEKLKLGELLKSKFDYETRCVILPWATTPKISLRFVKFTDLIPNY